MLCLNVIAFAILLSVDAGNEQITFPKSDEIQLLIPRDAALHLGLKTLVNLKEKNAVVSPANVYSCLRLLYAGARGDTKTELRNLLGTVSEKELRVPDVYTANALFLSPDVSVKHDYLTSNNQSVFSLDFEDRETARQVINQWVSNETRGKIPGFLEWPLDSASVAVVISALYFNASWLNKFNNSATTLGDFEVPGEGKIPVDLMTMSALLPVFHGSSFKVVGLPYENMGFSFYIFLPHSSGIRALKNMIRHLTPEDVEKMVASMQEENLVVTVPKFLLNARTEFRPVLQSLGLNKMFDQRNADFGDLIDATNGTKLFVSNIFQAVYLKVDEGGTEGAAATGAILTKSGRSVFRANRPFLFMLRHSSGQVLFLGTLIKPSQ